MQYTKEIEEDLYLTYGATPTYDTVIELAKKYNVNTKSIVAKLSSMKIYRKKAYVKKTDVTKNDLITSIGTNLNIDLDLLESLEKVPKYVLVILDQRVNDLLE
jgi:Zn-dependent peptidase ImmA (M78 family)